MTKNLMVGSTGNEVRQVQEMLNFLVRPQPALAVDGIFGPKTRAAAVQFQSLARLSPDGIVGPLTSKALVSSVLATVLQAQAGSPRIG